MVIHRADERVNPQLFAVPTIYQIFLSLSKALGPQHWWPAESPFEVIIGGILTQNTAWVNVEKALANLKKAGIFSPQALCQTDLQALSLLIRPAGYYNQKAKKIKNFLNFFFSAYDGDLSRMWQESVNSPRGKLLQVPGIGEETADSILLYAGEKPIFVVDAYTMRLVKRHRLVEAKISYGEVQRLFMENLPRDTELYNEYHALLVRLGKEFCRKREPLCHRCPLRGYLNRVKEVL